MSLKLVDQITFELEQMRQLLAESREITKISINQVPPATTRWALGAVLHAFYNGVENIFNRISSSFDVKQDRNGGWHIDLLTRMAVSTSNRTFVISVELLSVLKKYLAFRHLFRSIYTHELKWEPMVELVLGIDDAFEMFENEVQYFVKHLKTPSNG